MTTLRIGASSLVGQVRSANEDSYLVTDELVAVADGMGGHRAGEVASAETVEVLRAAGGSRSVEDLVAAVHRANRSINERAAEDDELRGMGTTVCVVGLVRYDDEDELAVLNVGDSRVYLFAAGELTRMTEDHSLVETLVREGRISAEEAEHHPQRNVITRALGVEALVVVDAWLLRPCDGDRLLLCSDGLFGEVGESRIAEILAEDAEPEVVARRLAAEADASGGRDNITTVVVDVTATGSPAAPLGERYRRISTPAIDMSDPDEDGPRTQTVMAVIVPASDDGGPGGAGDEDGDGEQGGEGHDGDDEPTVRAEAEAGIDAATRTGSGRSRSEASDTDLAEADLDDADIEDPDIDDADVEDTDPDHGSAAGEDADVPRGRPWRTALFVLAVAALIAVMAAVLLLWSRSGWVVTERDHTVVLLRGPKNGVLFLGPEEVKRYRHIDVGALTGSERNILARGQGFDSFGEAERFVTGLVDESRNRSTTTTTTSITTTTTVATTTVATTTTPTGP